MIDYTIFIEIFTRIFSVFLINILFMSISVYFCYRFVHDVFTDIRRFRRIRRAKKSYKK